MENNIDLIRANYKTLSHDEIYEDPFIKEFLAFCKINELEGEAAKLLGKKIKEKKLAKNRF